MKTATITEIKNRLSAFLDRVKRGESILITDRGRPVARLDSVIGAGNTDFGGRIARLERAGLVKRARVHPRSVAVTPLVVPRGVDGRPPSLLEAVLAEREENR